MSGTVTLTFTGNRPPTGDRVHFDVVAGNVDCGAGSGGGTTASGPEQLYYVHADHLNTPRLVTNEQQQAVWKWENFEPFGDSAANENPANLGVFAFNLRFAGQYFDQETRTHYNYYRDYDPSTGRYVQPDPVGLGLFLSEGFDALATRFLSIAELTPVADVNGVANSKKHLPVTPALKSRDLNHLYGYAEQDPIRRADPKGLLPGGVDSCEFVQCPLKMTIGSPPTLLCVYECFGQQALRYVRNPLLGICPPNYPGTL